MRVAVLIKQVPVPGDLDLVDGRLRREGVDVEVNAYCRRANAKAVELAGEDGEVVVFTMGPSSAEDALREMIACGATRGVHLVDRAFAGADTLATARVLAAAIEAEGRFDLTLCGLNSVDADTGQVGPEVAEMLGLPFAPGVRELEIVDGAFKARLETDDGYADVEGRLPAVLSCAERLISPSKAEPQARAAVPDGAIRRVGAAELGLAPAQVGASGSPTSVGPVRLEAPHRQLQMAPTVSEAVRHLQRLKVFGPDDPKSPDDPNGKAPAVPETTGRNGPEIWCFLEPNPDRPPAGLLGEAAALAAGVSGHVCAITPEPVPPGLGELGADRIVVVPGAAEPEQWTHALAAAAAERQPWALLLEATRTGRAVAAAVAARQGWGLTGDAVGFEIHDGRLAAWKPAFGGALIALIKSSSPVQMATVRPGIFSRRTPRPRRQPDIEVLAPPRPARIRTLTTERSDTDSVALLAADFVVGVGAAVDPADYPLVDKLCGVLGAELGATRKVTDLGWMPRSRQIGLTGHAISPRLYIAVGTSGKYNHAIGIRQAGAVLAINSDRAAPIFEHADIGVVAPWKPAVEELVAALSELTPPPPAARPRPSR